MSNSPDDADRRPSPDARDFRVHAFGPITRPLVRSLAEALFHDEARPPGEAAERYEWVTEQADDFAGHASAQLAMSLRLAAIAVEWLPLIVVGRFTRASSMSAEARSAYVSALERHPISWFALLVVAWKTLLTIVWFEHPENAKELQYDGRHERHLAIGKAPRAAHRHVAFRRDGGVTAPPVRVRNVGSFVRPS
jgi:hypothetical protein